MDSIGYMDPRNFVQEVLSSVGSEPKLGSVLARAFGQKSSARHILQKSSVQLGLLYDLKTQVTLKNKKMS